MVYKIFCTKCDFKWVGWEVDRFYVDNETGELEEYFQGILKINHDGDIFGKIYRTYCPTCDKLIKTYSIRESKYSKEESIKKVEELIKKSDVNESMDIDLLIMFSGPGEGEKSNYEFIEKFRNNENILTIVRFEELGTRDIEDVKKMFKKKGIDWNDVPFEFRERFLKYEKNIKPEIDCPKCGREYNRTFHSKKCPICGEELKSEHLAALD